MGVGIAGAAFWMFLAIIFVAVVWQKISNRREAHKTMRLAIEKGQTLDDKLVLSLLEEMPQQKQRLRLDVSNIFFISGVITLAVGLGLPVMGYFIGLASEGEALLPLTGVGFLVDFVAIALLILSRVLRRADLAETQFTRGG